MGFEESRETGDRRPRLNESHHADETESTSSSKDSAAHLASMVFAFSVYGCA